MEFYPGITLEQMHVAYRDQYLTPLGWPVSVEARAAIDRNGHPLPWLTYPAIRFLEKAVQPGWRVFEFGCGNSTLWWSRRVAEVCSVDHDAGWIARVGDDPSSRRTALLRPAWAPLDGVEPATMARYFSEVSEPPLPPDPGYCFRAGLLSAEFRAYAATIAAYPSGYFDVVVVDGMARSLTTWMAVQHARPRQFIIFDNSDREVYAPAYTILASAGYRRIDFWGSGPVNPYEWCTSVFLRSLDPLPTS